MSREPKPPQATGTTERRARRRRRRWPRITAVAVLAGLLVAGAVYGAGVMLPASWDARVGLLALPTEAGGSALLTQSGVSTSYGEVVNLALPSIGDVVTSPSVLEAVSTSVPGAPSPDELGSRINVELLSGSGVARITVTADDPQLAARLAEAVGKQVIKADLLAPAGKLQLLDQQATVRRTSPDPAFAGGLALIAGLAAAVVAALLMRPFRPRAGAGQAAVEAITLAGRGPATLLDADDPELVERARVLVRAHARPVRVVGASPGVADSVLALQSDLVGPDAAAGSGTASVLVVVDRTGARREDVDDALGALPPEASVLAVVVV